jgi:hypothetical protein
VSDETGPTDARLRAFAADWIDCWNRRDLEAMLSHYAEDARMNSPLARRLTGNAVITGVDRLRAYWTEGLARRPNLHFELIEAFPGADSLAIQYRDETGRRVIETLIFDPQGKVAIATACYEG